MRNIGVSEWAARLEELAVNAAQDSRPFVLTVGADNRLTVECSNLYGYGPSACLSLRAGDRRSFLVEATVESASGVTGSLERVQASVDQMQDLLRVTRRLHAPFVGLVVWPDDCVPCDFCSATGKARGAPCDRCSGTGARATV